MKDKQMNILCYRFGSKLAEVKKKKERGQKVEREIPQIRHDQHEHFSWNPLFPLRAMWAGSLMESDGCRIKPDGDLHRYPANIVSHRYK